MNAALTVPPPSATRVRIRSFEPGDAAKISALFTRHTNYRRDAAFWIWLNRIMPTRPSIVVVADVEGDVVGHYGILPLELRCGDSTPILAGHGLHAFVSPDWRREVSICQISAEAYRLARGAGLQFVFGFPNPNYRLVQEKIERWREVSLFKAWTKPVGAAGPGTAKLVAADLRDDAQLHAAIALWEQSDRESPGVRVAGQARWWSARYVQHPHTPYQFHWLVLSDERHGLVVTKVFRGEGEVRAHVIDHVLSAGASCGDLLLAFEKTFSPHADRFVHWPTEPDFTAALTELGYQPDGFQTYFGLRPLQNISADPAWLDPAAWRLPMGFSDAF